MIQLQTSILWGLWRLKSLALSMLLLLHLLHSTHSWNIQWIKKPVFYLSILQFIFLFITDNNQYLKQCLPLKSYYVLCTTVHANATYTVHTLSDAFINLQTAKLIYYTFKPCNLQNNYLLWLQFLPRFHEWLFLLNSHAEK